MEPPEKPIVYCYYAKVENVITAENITGWGTSFVGVGSIFWLGGDTQPLRPGDRVKITITKEPADAQST